MKGFENQRKSKKKKISNKNIKLSKEQIIKQAINFHLQDNIQEASKYYQYCLNQNFNDYRVFSNYGVILKDLGKLKQAENYYRKAIELNPNFANAHSNLGNILRDLGKLQEAEISLSKAIELNPDFADAHSNMGNILKDLGKLQQAENSYRKAIELNPDFANAHSNLGSILRDLGKLKQAENSYRKAIELNPNFANAHSNLGSILVDLGKSQEAFICYLKAIEINPSLSNIYASITDFLNDSDPSQLNKSKLKYILNLLLERHDISHNKLFKAFHFLYSNEITNNLEEFLFKDKLIINALKKIIFCDLKLEKTLTKLRKNICDRIAKNTNNINFSELQFIIALGEQCFLNEYIYSLTEEESISVNTIIKKCRDGEANETTIAILSCYIPLYKLLDEIASLRSFNSYTQSFKELIKLQISEPIKEIEFSKNIKSLGTINDQISLKVKSQYEENPYPRWRYGSHLESQKISITQAINHEIKPNYISRNVVNEQVKVLIAGCGTGNQILQAQKYKNAQVTAIDLSLSSLSYAQRKINELGINNIELIQMDILEVSLLEERFDIVESSGVLHHMNDPSKGLKALLGVLKNNGFLKLGLYSELARQDVVKARNYITSKKIEPNEGNIRNFRQKVFSGELRDLKTIKRMGDFYSLSQCRDLCFHAKEHRFTINQLQETLKSNELKFLGFLLRQPVKSQYKKYFPEDKKQTNLESWAKFEEKHATTFTEMYQFWVCKTKI